MGTNGLTLTILTPDRTVLSESPVDYVSMPAFDGELGVLPGHASYAVQLREGVLRYRAGTKMEAFSILGGFAEIHRNRVTILAEAAELAEEVSEERARQAEMRAKEKLIGREKDMDLEEATAALRRAGARLKAARLRAKDKRHSSGPDRLPGG